MRQLGDGVDASGLEQLRILSADAFDSHQVGVVDELQQLVFRDARLIGQHRAAFLVAARLEQALDAADAGTLELLAQRRSDPLYRVQFSHFLILLWVIALR